MDLNDDGHDDVITGSYWPGHIYVFEGRGKGEYAKGYQLLGADGEKLHAGPAWKSEREPQMDSLAAAPHMIDWDADGDLDLMVGNISGRVILIENQGTAKQAAFSMDRRAIEAGGSAIRVPGGDAGPITADWDRDGRWDLIVGAGDGSVHFYRNTGTASTPQFAKGRVLLAKGDRGYKPLRHDEAPTWHGSRAKVCAVDYDNDGMLDLLVGGFQSIQMPEPQLTDEQKERRDELQAEQKEVSKKMSELYQKHYKDDPDKYQEDVKPISARYSKIYQELRPLIARQDPTGYVWLHRQKSTTGQR